MTGRSGLYRHLTSIIVGATGAALLAAALWTGAVTHWAYRDLTAKCPNMTCDDVRQPSLRTEFGFGRALSRSTDVLLALGAAGLIAGAVLFSRESRRVRAAANP